MNNVHSVVVARKSQVFEETCYRCWQCRPKGCNNDSDDWLQSAKHHPPTLPVAYFLESTRWGICKHAPHWYSLEEVPRASWCGKPRQSISGRRRTTAADEQSTWHSQNLSSLHVFAWDPWSEHERLGCPILQGPNTKIQSQKCAYQTRTSHTHTYLDTHA